MQSLHSADPGGCAPLPSDGRSPSRPQGESAAAATAPPSQGQQTQAKTEPSAVEMQTGFLLFYLFIYCFNCHFAAHKRTAGVPWRKPTKDLLVAGRPALGLLAPGVGTRESRSCFQAFGVFVKYTIFLPVIQSFWEQSGGGNFPSLISLTWRASGKHTSICMSCLLVTRGQLLRDCWHKVLSPLQMMTGLQNSFRKREFLQCSHHEHLRRRVPSGWTVALR